MFKFHRKYLFILIPVIVIAVVIYFYSRSTNLPLISLILPPTSIYNQLDYSRPTNVTPVTYPPTPATQTAWIPDWAFTAGFTTLQNNWQYFSSVSPVWYYVQDDGTIKENRVGYDKLRTFTQGKNIEMIPTISSFSADQMQIILDSDESIQRHVDYLTSQVVKYNYDGIDLDYESIYLFNQNSFLQLVQKLSDFLKPRNKKLTIAVLAKWTNDQAYNGLVQTRKVQNWAILEPYIDQFRIMTYDYTSAHSLEPGPSAPLDWQEAVVRYALRYLPPQKIMLGANLYGNVWEDLYEHRPAYASYLENGWQETAPGISGLTIAKLDDRYKSKVAEYADTSGERIFSYRTGGKTWKAFAPSVATNQKRLDLVSKYNIAGIAYWRLGDDNNAILRLIYK